MNKNAIERLQRICDTIPELLKAIPHDEMHRKSSAEKWSKIQIIGHLIDSAFNNHQRFIRAQYEQIPFIVYNQNEWNVLNAYEQKNITSTIDLWKSLNCHLIHVYSQINSENLTKLCNTGDKDLHTIEWLFTDYVDHLEHHLKQVLLY